MISDNLIVFILEEVGVALVLAIICLLLIILQLLKKLVVSVAVVSVATDATSYEHTNPVNIKGSVMLDDVPQANTPVNLKIVDIAGTEFALPDATTATDGTFTATWTIPPEVAPGVCTLSATALGMTATSTFTFRRWKHRSR